MPDSTVTTFVGRHRRSLLRRVVGEVGASRDGDRRDERRLDVLLLDYEMARDDDRHGQAVQATLISVALGVLALLGALVTQSCSAGQAVDCLQVPEPVLAGAPFLPLALLAYVTAAGSISTLRNVYMRSLEREIRLELDAVELRSYPGLPVASFVELTTTYSTVARGGAGGRQLASFLLTGILVIFGGLTVVLATRVDPWLQLLMAGVYGAGAALIIAETRRATILGRVFFQGTVAGLQWRLQGPLTPIPSAESSSPQPHERSLLSYLVLPRPDDLVKVVFLPAAAAAAIAWLPHDPQPWPRALALWAILELLIYQARYQWNDIIGQAQDRAHPEARLRGRLPSRPGHEREAAIMSAGVIAVRLWAACWLAAGVGLGWWAPVLIVAVFGIGSVYEALRRWQPPPQQHPHDAQILQRRLAQVAWTTFIVVGAGYIIRGMTGIALAGVPWPALSETYLLLALFLWTLGCTFVTLVWALEACSYLVEHDGHLVPLAQLARRPHLVYLLGYLQLDHPVGSPLNEEASNAAVTTPDGSPYPTTGSQIAALLRRGRVAAPWNLFTVLGGCYAATAGCVLGSLGPQAALTAMVIGTGGATGLVLVDGPRWRLATAAATVAILGGSVIVTPGAVSGWEVLGLLLPWVAHAAVVVAFRAQTYRGLKFDWNYAGYRLRRNSAHLWGQILSPDFIEALSRRRSATRPSSPPPYT